LLCAAETTTTTTTTTATTTTTTTTDLSGTMPVDRRWYHLSLVDSCWCRDDNGEFSSAVVAVVVAG
jgi:hypothetical protein